jgi:hypothetical protein
MAQIRGKMDVKEKRRDDTFFVWREWKSLITINLSTLGGHLLHQRQEPPLSSEYGLMKSSHSKNNLILFRDGVHDYGNKTGKNQARCLSVKSLIIND